MLFGMYVLEYITSNSLNVCAQQHLYNPSTGSMVESNQRSHMIALLLAVIWRCLKNNHPHCNLCNRCQSSAQK